MKRLRNKADTIKIALSVLIRAIRVIKLAGTGYFRDKQVNNGQKN